MRFKHEGLESMGDLPSSVLFACTMNSIRSPMAEATLKFLHGHKIYVDSVGVSTSDIDGFAIAVMEEVGIDLAGHKSKRFDDLEDNFYDVVISLSPEAQHRAVLASILEPKFDQASLRNRRNL